MFYFLVLYKVHMTRKSIFLAGIYSHIGTTIAWLNSHLLSCLSATSWKNLFETPLEILFSFLATIFSCSVAPIISDGQMHFLF